MVSRLPPDHPLPESTYVPLPVCAVMYLNKWQLQLAVWGLSVLPREQKLSTD